MARYVLLEFDDNAAAQKFVAKVNGEYHAVDSDFSTRRVKAVWGKPTKFCECVRGTKGANPFYRAKKSGWWVHYPCGRPTKMWAKGNHWFSAIGRNLLPGNKDYTPGGWGVDSSPDAENTGLVTPLGEDQVPAAVTGERVKKRKKRERDRPRRATPPGDMTDQGEWWKRNGEGTA